MSVETDEGALVLTPRSAAPPRELGVAYPLAGQENIAAVLTGAYLLGFEIITVSGASIPDGDREAIRNSLRRLVGMEIVEEDGSHVSIQFLPDAASLRPQMILRRMSALVVGMYADVAAAMGSADRAGLGAMRDRDAEVNRQYFLLVRLVRSVMTDRRLASAFSLANIDVLDYRVAANLVEGAGDTVVELAEALARTSVPRADLLRARRAAAGLTRVAELAVEGLVARDRGLGIEAIKAHRAAQARLASLRAALARRPQVPLDYLDMLHMLERIEQSWSDVADLITPSYSAEAR